MIKDCSFAFCGDSFITRNMPYNSSLSAVSDYLLKFDLRFTNLEVCLHDFNIPASAVSGGTWAGARPSVLDTLVDNYGFNAITFANNHSADWGIDGIKSTMEHLQRRNVSFAGCGNDLKEASNPSYIDLPCGRIAMVGVSTIVNPNVKASLSVDGIPARPGINYIRFKRVHNLLRKDYDALLSILKKYIVSVKELSDSSFFYGERYFNAVDDEGNVRNYIEGNKKDIDRLLTSVEIAKYNADFVFVSFHSHIMQGETYDVTPDFIKKIAMYVVDAGGDAFIGHGVHVLRGIDFYKGKPLLYGLNSFIFMNSSVEKQPYDFYENYDIDDALSLDEAIKIRNQTKEYEFFACRDAFDSMICSLDIKDNKVSALRIKPLVLKRNKDDSLNGFPIFAKDDDYDFILDRIRKLSDSVGDYIKDNRDFGCIML